jgi:hypothetical protein
MKAEEERLKDYWRGGRIGRRDKQVLGRQNYLFSKFPQDLASVLPSWAQGVAGSNLVAPITFRFGIAVSLPYLGEDTNADRPGRFPGFGSPATPRLPLACFAKRVIRRLHYVKS